MLLAGCASDSPDPNVPDPSLKVSDTEICPSASISAISRAFSGPVDSAFPPSSEGVMSVTALVDSEEGSWTNYFCNKPADTDSNSKISFTESNPMRFYPYDGSRRLRFYATSPWRESWTMDESTHTLAFALSGQEDLMWGKDESGISKALYPAAQTQPQFDFTHKLTRFNFCCRAGEGFPNRIRLTEIKMYGVCSTPQKTDRLVVN